MVDKRYVPFLKNIGMTCMHRMNETKELLLGIEEIDNQHIKIYDLLCQIVKEKKKNNKEGVMVNVEKLLEIWETHFEYEEDLMELYTYSGCDEHKKKHDNMREEISNLKKMYSKGFKYVVTILERSLNQWVEEVIEHITGEDKDFGKYLHSKGVT